MKYVFEKKKKTRQKKTQTKTPGICELFFKAMCVWGPAKMEGNICVPLKGKKKEREFGAAFCDVSKLMVENLFCIGFLLTLKCFVSRNASRLEIDLIEFLV